MHFSSAPESLINMLNKGIIMLWLFLIKKAADWSQLN